MNFTDLVLKTCKCGIMYHGLETDIMCGNCEFDQARGIHVEESRRCQECGVVLDSSDAGRFCYLHDMRSPTLPGDDNAHVTEEDYEKFNDIIDAKRYPTCHLCGAPCLYAHHSFCDACTTGCYHHGLKKWEQILKEGKQNV